MDKWGPITYGDPCAECGFGWGASQDESIRVVTGTPGRYAALLVGRSGRAQHPNLDWTATGYVCHVADNLRVWAERLAGLATGDRGPVAPYDERSLAVARRYESVGLHGALWSLSRAADDWLGAVTLADRAHVVLFLPDRGPQSLEDVVRSNAHDAHHHGWDIERSLAAEEG